MRSTGWLFWVGVAWLVGCSGNASDDAMSSGGTGGSGGSLSRGASGSGGASTASAGNGGAHSAGSGGVGAAGRSSDVAGASAGGASGAGGTSSTAAGAAGASPNGGSGGAFVNGGAGGMLANGGAGGATTAGASGAAGAGGSGVLTPGSCTAPCSAALALAVAGEAPYISEADTLGATLFWNTATNSASLRPGTLTPGAHEEIAMFFTLESNPDHGYSEWVQFPWDFVSLTPDVYDGDTYSRPLNTLFTAVLTDGAALQLQVKYEFTDHAVDVTSVQKQ